MKLHTFTKLVVVFLVFSSSVVSAQQTQVAPTPTPVPITVTRAWLHANENRADAGFRNRVIVEVEHLSEAVQKDKINPRNFVLFLDGRALKGVNVAGIEGSNQPNGPTRLAFDLHRTEDSDPVWRSLLGSPRWRHNYREVGVSVGLPDKEPIPQSTPGYRPVIYLRLYHRWSAVLSLIALIVVIGVFVYLAKKGHLIRDSNPPRPDAGKKKPFSLALSQAAWWFFLVIGSFVFIYIITGDYNSMTDQALILIGIGIGTALGSFMISATKQDTADTELRAVKPEQAKLAAEVQLLSAKETELKTKVGGVGATTADELALRDNAVALEEKRAKLKELENQIADAEAGLSKPFSEGFRKDILTDVNGITLHRFQMVVWTIVLGVVFLIGVYRDLAMPQFSATLLALMGISAGTYLGFKIPERQVDPNEEKKGEAKPK